MQHRKGRGKGCNRGESEKSSEGLRHPLGVRSHVGPEPGNGRREEEGVISVAHQRIEDPGPQLMAPEHEPRPHIPYRIGIHGSVRPVDGAEYQPGDGARENSPKPDEQRFGNGIPAVRKAGRATRITTLGGEQGAPRPPEGEKGSDDAEKERRLNRRKSGALRLSPCHVKKEGARGYPDAQGACKGELQEDSSRSEPGLPCHADQEKAEGNGRADGDDEAQDHCRVPLYSSVPAPKSFTGTRSAVSDLLGLSKP